MRDALAARYGAAGEVTYPIAPASLRPRALELNKTLRRRSGLVLGYAGSLNYGYDQALAPLLQEIQQCKATLRIYSLQKPWFNPPNYLFAPVWTTLYILMGVSLYYVWRAGFHYLRRQALTVFGVQLLLNFAWSLLFFSAHALLLSVIDIIFLWIMIVWMIIVNWRIRPAAGWLQVPYLLWVSFASALDIAIWTMNPNS